MFSIYFPSHVLHVHVHDTRNTCVRLYGFVENIARTISKVPANS